MQRLFKKLLKQSVFVFVFIAVALAFYYCSPGGEKIDFSRDVKPILNKNCISCHGGVKAKGGFSVLFKEEAFANTESGKPAIIPGDPDASEMIRRIRSGDPEDRMPYRHEPLSEGDIDILTRWIKQGAEWGDHWAYLPVEKPDVPDVKNNWIRNDLDKFIIKKLEGEKLEPSAEAGKPHLLRRASLDLIGIYPSREVAERYLNSDSDKAYEELIDSLLASPHFGEKWTAMWLDLARYADSKGYESDGGRDIWKYRDWLIRAFNQDKPYDQFLTEQIAGDLLPGPTDDHYIATAFHRNTMTNDEGGTDNEEYRTIAVMDRVNTTWESLMGTTFACVQCHSHPYDPFRHEEYYRFLAYFNNTRDEDLPADYPLLRIPDEEQSEQVEKLVNWVNKNSGDSSARSFRKFLRTMQPAIYAIKAEGLANATMDFNVGFLIRSDGVFRLKNVNLEHCNQLVFTYTALSSAGRMSIHLDSADAPPVVSIQIPSSVKPGRNGYESAFMYVDFPRQRGVHDVYFRYKNPTIPPGSQTTGARFTWFAFLDLPDTNIPGSEEQRLAFRKLLEAQMATVPVMVENPAWMKRTTHVFERGNMKTLGKEVSPGVPNSLAMAMPEGAPANRKGLALWLTDKKNPLVSRTFVNRIWEQLFGRGLVETLEDMGTQGVTPTHQDILDYYSYRFMHELNWSVKGLLKELVMSATYRQDSRVTDALKEKDIENKLYARGPRIRLSAEQIRDQHLCISGMLSPKMYGPGVMPWQPEGIWGSPYNSAKWINAEGDDKYRRAVYTYWKRSAPYPSLMTFDASQRVICVARRIRTNTPLQALVTLNDSVYVDISRRFALRMKQEAGNDIRKQIEYGYELMLFRTVKEDDMTAFLGLFDRALKEFKENPAAALDMMGGDSENSDPSTAALAVVANAMLNLDEVVMKN